jgi:hypothetical protein
MAISLKNNTKLFFGNYSGKNRSYSLKKQSQRTKRLRQRALQSTTLDRELFCKAKISLRNSYVLGQNS